jgi:heat shock protein HtpX
MWEQIQSNKRRTWVLVFSMLLLLLTLGFLIGVAVVPSLENMSSETPGISINPIGGLLGVVIAFGVWAVMATVSYFQGDSILLSMSGARRIKKEDHPQLYNVVEEMTIASSLPKVPNVYIVDDMALNAFATGRKPENASVAVTAGLLGKLNRDQLQGVVAHEVGHIVNRDVLLMTMAGVMVGSIVVISDIFLRGMFHGSRYRSSKRSKGGGGGSGQAALLILAVVFAVLAPILAQCIYMAISRRREYLADASATVYTRYPEGLAGALEAISGDRLPLESANRATAPMYIINPLRGAKSFASSLSRTHPPTEDRIRILRSMAGGVSFANYQTAWSKAQGKAAGHLPQSALAGGEEAAIREAHPDAIKQEEDARKRKRDAGDLLRNLNEFVFLNCLCGLKLKLPPDFKKDHLDCPKCNRKLAVPTAQLAALAVVSDAIGKPGSESQVPKPQEPEAPLEITRKSGEWMTFKCPCGGTKTLSPDFGGTRTWCPKCNREIHVK